MGFDPKQVIPLGWEQGEEFSVQGDNVSVAQGAVGTVIATLNIPPGHKYFMNNVSLRVVDVGGGEVTFFGIARNGIRIPSFRRIPGTQVDNVPTVDTFILLEPGTITLVVDNEGAIGAIRCQGSIFGFTVRNAFARPFATR